MWATRDKIDSSMHTPDLIRWKTPKKHKGVGTNYVLTLDNVRGSRSDRRVEKQIGMLLGKAHDILCRVSQDIIVVVITRFVLFAQSSRSNHESGPREMKIKLRTTTRTVVGRQDYPGVVTDNLTKGFGKGICTAHQGCQSQNATRWSHDDGECM